MSKKVAERAVELGEDRASLGRSLPFLGKGPVWFKMKWSGTVSCGPGAEHLHLLLDLRHRAVRRMLSVTPVIHSQDDALVASAWLEPGEKSAQAVVRDAGRFPGISRWYVLAPAETLAASAATLSACDEIVPVPVSSSQERPVWLGEVLE